MRNSLEGRRMAANTFLVLAGRSKGTAVVNINSCADWGSRGLVSKWTVLLSTFEVEFADCFMGIFVGLGAFNFHGGGYIIDAHLVVAICGLRFSGGVGGITIPRVVGTCSVRIPFNPVKEGSPLQLTAAVLESGIDGWLDHSLHLWGHYLSHHLSLLFKHSHQLHLLLRCHLHHAPIGHVAILGPQLPAIRLHARSTWRVTPRPLGSLPPMHVYPLGALL